MRSRSAWSTCVACSPIAGCARSSGPTKRGRWQVPLHGASNDLGTMCKRFVSVLATALVLAACSATGPTTGQPAWSYAAPAATQTALAAAREVVVYKSPSCTCCHEWEAYMADRGFTVRSVPTDDMASVKQDLGIPESAWSCHTAVIDGYAIEGHVPAEAIEDLLARRPAIDGIALPGMPPGSPGMPGDKAAPFAVLSVSDGATSEFGSY